MLIDSIVGFVTRTVEGFHCPTTVINDVYTVSMFVTSSYLHIHSGGGKEKYMTFLRILLNFHEFSRISPELVIEDLLYLRKNTHEIRRLVQLSC